METLAQMRDTINPEGSAAFLKLNQKVDEISKEAEKKSGLWPFPANTCPFATTLGENPLCQSTTKASMVGDVNVQPGKTGHILWSRYIIRRYCRFTSRNEFKLNT